MFNSQQVKWMNELTAVDDCVGVYTMQCRLLDYFLKDLASVHTLADMVWPRFDLDHHWFDLHKQRSDKVPFHTELWCERELAGKLAGVASRVLCKRHLPHTRHNTQCTHRDTLCWTSFLCLHLFVCLGRGGDDHFISKIFQWKGFVIQLWGKVVTLLCKKKEKTLIFL